MTQTTSPLETEIHRATAHKRKAKTGKILGISGGLGAMILAALFSAQAFMGMSDKDSTVGSLEANGNRVSALSDTAQASSSARSAKNVQSSQPLAHTPHRLQLNMSFLAPWDYEDPFLDKMKVQGYPDDYRWLFIFNDKYWNTKQAEENGFIDPVSGDMKRVPPGLIEVQGPTILPGYEKFPGHYAGDWVFTWKGSAIPVLNPDQQSQNIRIKSFDEARNRLVFSMPASGAKPFRFVFRNVQSPLHTPRLYRVRDEPAAEAGHLWDPAFVEYVRPYDIIRPMLTQDMNDTPVRSWAEVATPDDPHFIHRQPMEPENRRPRTGRYGLPYEYLLDLAIKTDSALWMHVPIQLGSPVHHADFGGDIQPVFNAALKNSDAILASPAWDEFAANLAERIKTSGYPKDRPLYIELGNEVWNFAWPFVIATKYAEGIARGQTQNEGTRYGYGLLSGRLIEVMENALAGSGYTITYIIAGQTAVPDTTKVAYRGLMDYFKAKNLDTRALLNKTGVALTTYHGGSTAYEELLPAQPGKSLTQLWEQAIAEDADGLQKKLHARYVYGGSSVLFGKQWVVDRWAEHQQIAAQFGVQIIGAYEGGSHDNPPEELSASPTFMKWWTRYHWGPYGADVVRQVNEIIADTYPGVILSNFISQGEIGNWKQPFIDGHYSDDTSMSRMWKEFETKQNTSEQPN